MDSDHRVDRPPVARTEGSTALSSSGETEDVDGYGPLVEVADGVATVRPHGDVDARSAPGLRAELERLLDDPTVTAIVVDLATVRFVDSSGLGTLIGVNTRARGSATTLRLRHPQSQLLRLMAMTSTYSTFSWG